MATPASVSAPGPTESIQNPSLSHDVRKALNQFDEKGRLRRLPSKYSILQLVVWGIWIYFEDGRKYSEREVNQILNAKHTFKDQSTLRRELVNMKLLGRKSDCSEYWREAAQPTDDAKNLIVELLKIPACSSECQWASA